MFMRQFTRFYLILITLLLVICPIVKAGTLQHIDVRQHNTSTDVSFTFSLPSKFSYFYLQNPDRLVIDFQNSQLEKKQLLPQQVAGSTIKKIRTSTPPRSTALRIVIELQAAVKASFTDKGAGKTVIVNIPTKNTKKTTNVSPSPVTTKASKAQTKAPINSNVLTIAIDAGHGGRDPGAIGTHLRIKEKNITLQIAKELQGMLDRDPRFRSVLTRSDDYFISVPDRSEIARKKQANYLVSIHADSNHSANFKGASVWVLSNQRANNEMGKWLEDHEKQSQLLGGAGNVLSSHHEKYLDQTVLDLQFGHSQRVGYLLGKSILKRMGNIANLSKTTPQHASLGVLRSPDIPSVLVETGFLSNPKEEQLLSTAAYRKKMANAIYQGLIDYYNSSAEVKQTTTGTAPNYHVVKPGETLGLISIKYNIKLRELRRLNDLKNDNIHVGQKIKLK